MAHFQNWGCPIFLQRHTDLYSFQLLQSLPNLFLLYVFRPGKQMWTSDKPGVLFSGFKSQRCHKVVIFIRGPLKVFHWHKRLFGFISMPSCHPIASLWPHRKLWHLEPRGGRIWPIYRTVSNVPAWISRILTCFETKSLLHSIFKVDYFLFQFVCSFSVMSVFSPLLIWPRPFKSATAKVAALRRTVVNKQTQNHISAEDFFWGGHLHRFFFLGWWQHGARSQVREEPSVTDRSQWPGRPGRRQEGTGGVEGFGGGEGKAHLLYSWPLCVKQALWALTERRARTRPLVP